MNRLLSIICLFVPLSLSAQEKHVTSTKMFGVGYNSVQDTYLSPEHYGGPEVRYLSHTVRERAEATCDSNFVQEGKKEKAVGRGLSSMRVIFPTGNHAPRTAQRFPVLTISSMVCYGNGRSSPTV